LKGAFRPEFFNRIDEIIMFSPLSLEQMEEIVVLQMKEVQDRLNDHNITVELTDAARKWLAKEGYDPAFGARPLRRAIQKICGESAFDGIARRQIQGRRGSYCRRERKGEQDRLQPPSW
jgi:ATP-dependent Clp protease ATP-binding subunit ClpB